LAASTSDPSWGTGWVIDGSGPDRIIVTNRHVASLVAKRAVDACPISREIRSLYRLQGGGRQRVGQASSFEVLDIPYLADTAAPDVALMRITGHDLPSVLPLVDKEAAVGNLVALIDIPPVTTGTT